MVLPSPQAGGRLTDSAEWRKALLVALAGGVIRLLVAALTPLFPDETYYWEWSRHLSAGYFDHPPLIAWTIRLGTLMFSDTVVGVRFGPVLAGIVATLFLAAAARRLASDRAAFMAALIFSVLPLSAAGLILATPDAPLLAAASAVVYAVVRALEAAPRSHDSLRWWSISGVALGLALCAKYTAVLIPFGLLVAFAIRPTLRVRFAEPGPYVAVLIALLVFSPVILWNTRHDWISFAFQLQHGLGRVSGSAINRELELIGGQMGLITPILFVMLVIATHRAYRRPTSPTQPALAMLATVIFAFFMYSATKRRAEANWPALAYVPALLLLVAHEGATRWKRWLWGGIGLAAVLTVVTYVNAFTPVLPVPARRDPAARAHGWTDLARAVEAIHVTRRPISSYRTWIAADRYQDASELAFHLPGQPETFSLNLSGRANHYDLWPSYTDRAEPRDGLILVVDAVEGMHPTVAMLAPHFARVTAGEVITLARGGDPVKHMRMWVLDGWFGTWPKGRLRSRS